MAREQDLRSSQLRFRRRADFAPEITIVIPAFNAGATLEATLRCIETQSFAQWEVLIIDDGSTDKTLEIAQSFALSEPRASVLQHSGQRNRGQFASRILGARHASARLIALLDADDLWYPEYLEAHLHLRKALGATEATISYGPAMFVTGRATSILRGEVQLLPDGSPQCFAPGAILPHFLQHDYAMTPCPSAIIVPSSTLTSLWRWSSLAKRCAAFEDQLFIWSAALSHPVAIHDQVLMEYSVDVPGSATMSMRSNLHSALTSELLFLRTISRHIRRAEPEHELLRLKSLQVRIDAVRRKLALLLTESDHYLPIPAPRPTDTANLP